MQVKAIYTNLISSKFTKRGPDCILPFASKNTFKILTPITNFCKVSVMQDASDWCCIRTRSIQGSITHQGSDKVNDNGIRVVIVISVDFHDFISRFLLSFSFR